MRDLFMNSLKPHKYTEGATEITFDSGIILNIADIMFSPEIIPANTEKRLFNRGTLRSTYSFWRSDDFALNVQEPPFISLAKLKGSVNGFQLYSWYLKKAPGHLNGGLKTPEGYTLQATKHGRYCD
jgi:hypothetical protein